MAYKKKSYKKKRAFKRKAKKFVGRRKGRADGGHTEKLTSFHNFTVDGTGNWA